MTLDPGMLFGMGNLSPAMGQMMSDPEQFATIMAQAGVGPPKPPLPMAGAPPTPPQGQVGALMQPVVEEESGVLDFPDASGGSPQTQNPKLQKLMSSFRGVKAPEAPKQQRINSPYAPRPHVSPQQMDPSTLVKMLMGLGGGGGNPALGNLIRGG